MVSFDFGAVNGIKEHGDSNDGKADRLVAADSLRVRRGILDQLKQIFTDNTSDSGANGERCSGFKINTALLPARLSGRNSRTWTGRYSRIEN